MRMKKTPENILERAELMARKLRMNYNEDSIKFLEGYIERQKTREDLKNFDSIVTDLGSYVGECIIRNYNGTWGQDNRGFHIKFDDSNKVYPFSKVKKQFENGLSDPVLAFYRSIPIIYKTRLSTMEEIINYIKEKEAHVAERYLEMKDMSEEEKIRSALQHVSVQFSKTASEIIMISNTVDRGEPLDIESLKINMTKNIINTLYLAGQLKMDSLELEGLVKRVIDSK
jgi:CRISPR/Cas system CMR-associated protein Cmr5 small subunit